MADFDPIELDYFINNPGLLEQLGESERITDKSVKKMTQGAKDASGQIEEMFKNAAIATASYFSIDAAQNFVKQLIAVRGEYQQVEVAFTTMLQSKSAADKMMNDAINLAARTPFQLSDVAGGAKQLLAYGTSAKDVMSTISMLGNVASGVSAPLSDIIYLYGTLQTQGRAYARDIQQFAGRGIPIIDALAKQFGVTKDQVNDLVEAGKVGFPEVQKAFQSLTSSGGIFYNLMNEQSKTLTGQISNLEDAFNSMLNDIGKENQGALSDLIADLSSVVANYKQVISIVESLIAVYGVYRAALLLTAAAERAMELAQLQAALAGKELVGMNALLEGSYASLRYGIEGAAVALDGFMKTSGLANPYVGLAVAIGAAVVAFTQLNEVVDYGAKAHADYITQLVKEKNQLDQLFGALEGTKAGTDKRTEAVKKVVDAYKDYLPKMDLEKASLSELEQAYGKVNQKIGENIALKIKTQQSDALEKDFTAQIDKVVGDITSHLGDKQAGIVGQQLTDYIVQAQRGDIRLAPGMRDPWANGYGVAVDNMNKISASLDPKEKGLQDYLMRLQIIIDKQLEARKGLNDFLSGTQKPTPAKENGLTDAQKLAEQFKKALDALGDDKSTKTLADFTKRVSDALSLAKNEPEVEKIKKAVDDRIKAFTPGDARIAQFQKQSDRVQAVLDQYDGKKKKTALNQQYQVAQSYTDMMSKIHQANEGFNNASLTDDEQKLADIRKKFETLKDEIAKYNANPKNTKKIGAGVVANVQKAEQGALDNQVEDNITNGLAEDLDKRKQLYDQYEAYKEKVGRDGADAEYEEKLAGIMSFKEYLNTIKTMVLGDDLSPDQYEARSKIIQKLTDDEDAKQHQRMVDNLVTVLQATKTAASERFRIEEQYNKDVLLLQQNYHGADLADRLAVLKQYHDHELEETNKQAFQESQIYKDATVDVFSFSLAQLKEQIKKVKGEVKANDDLSNGDHAKMSPTQRNEIEGYINGMQDVEQKSDPVVKDMQSIAGLAAQAAQGFDQIASSIADTNPGLADTLSTLGQITSVLGSAAGLVGSVMTGNIAGIISGVVGVVTGVVKLFGQAKKSAQEAAAAIAKYQDDLIKGEIKYNELMRDRERSQQNITDLTLSELKAREDMLAQQKQQAQADYDKLLGIIKSSGQQITGEHTEKYGGILGAFKKTKVVQDLAGLSSADYDTLEKLYTEGKLTDTTKAWFEELQGVKTELDDIGESAQAAADQLAQVATGTTANAISDAIIEGFKNGKRTAADFADDFQNMMTQGLISAFESEVLSAKVEDFYKQFAALSESEGGLTPDKIKQLKDAYAKLINETGQQFEDLQKITGVNLTTGSDSGSSNSLAGAIKGMTTEEASVLGGQLGGMRLAQLDTNDKLDDISFTMKAQQLELKQQTLHLMQINQNTKRSADTLENGVLPELKSINNNTKDTASGVLRAAGLTK